MTQKQEKCRQSQLGRIVVHKGDIEKRIFPNELEQYLQAGWIKGQKESHKKNNVAAKGRIPWNKKTKGIMKSNKTSWKKGTTPWNKGLTKETNDILKRGGEKQQGKVGSNRGKKFSDEHKQKISRALSGKKRGPIPKDVLEIKLSKDYLTKKANNTFNTSAPEESLYKYLLKENVNKTIFRNYKDKERYPFYCDFYIKEDDMFIELHAHWTHGGQPYDPNSLECQQQLKMWQEKAKTSKFYVNAIETWTIRDVEKARIAKKNKLNYKVIY